MRLRLIAVLVAVFLLLIASGARLAEMDQSPDQSRFEWTKQLRKTIGRYLGYPYGYGCSGPKRFDCSGFVWRVMFESGIRIKRTGARKLFLMLPKADEAEQWQLGTVVFFNRLRHCGLVEDTSLFYHASSKLGTTCSSFEPYWHSRITGFRKIPRKHGGESPFL
jgi:cell wall-associated NlpC family hydrolase